MNTVYNQKIETAKRTLHKVDKQVEDIALLLAVWISVIVMFILMVPTKFLVGGIREVLTFLEDAFPE